MALQSEFLALWITFLLLAVGDWFGVGVSHTAGGYLGLVAALLAAYLSAAELINGEYGRTVLAIGAFTPAPAESPGRQEFFTEPKLGMRG